MITETINALTSFISIHPHSVGIVIFTATALESMAFIGSLFPGMSIVLAISAIAASFGANIWVLVLWCTMGAIVGDGASYWLGNKYGSHLKTMWPFCSHPGFLEKGTEFFQKNGGKSIVIGRFLPFTRAVVPVAAGMLGMNPVQFYVANVLSAIGWALMNILPAAGVGLAFTAINQVSSRVAVMLGVFGIIFVSALVFGHITVRLILPSIEKGLHQLVKKLRHGPKQVAGIATLFFGPESRPASTSTVWIILTLSLVLSFAKIFEDVVTNDPLVRMDVALNALTQGFRNPIGDQIMTALTSMGDTTVIFWACTTLVVGLLILKAWRTAGMAVFVFVTTAVFIPTLKTLLHKPRPFDLYSGAESFSFPSGHAAFSALIWGLIAVIGTRGLSQKNQATIWASVLTISLLVGLSRIYLSAHWPSDVMGGLLFGWIMASLFGLFVENSSKPVPRSGLLALITSVALVSVWGIYGTISFRENLARYQPQRQVISVSMSDWLTGGWKQIPSARIDLKGEYEEPLTFQIAAPPETIETVLQSNGWTSNPTLEWRQATQFYNGKKALTSLIPLPLLHNGTPAILTMSTPSFTEGRRYIFRLWQTPVDVGEQSQYSSILGGSITEEWVTHPFLGVNVLRDAPLPPKTIQKYAALLKSDRKICLIPVSRSSAKDAFWLIVPRSSYPCPDKEKRIK